MLEKRITEFVSCFISSLVVKVSKCRFLTPQEECYQDECVSLIKYGPCFATPLHFINDSYFDTLQFLFQKNTSFKFSAFLLSSSCGSNEVLGLGLLVCIVPQR